MTMKRFGVAALLLSAMALTTTGCGMMGMGNGEHGTKMSGKEHKKMFPKGHERSSDKNCYYDTETDNFLCAYGKE